MGSVETSPRAGKEGNNPGNFIQNFIVASLPQEEKKKYSQNQTGTKALFCGVAVALGLHCPGIPDPVPSGPCKGLCCSVTVEGQQPCSGLAHVALMVEKTPPCSPAPEH